MSSETPGGGVTTPLAGSSGDNIQISSLPRVRTISDEITIYEITAPIPSKPTLKPLSFEVPHDLFKGSPIKMSPQKLSPMSGGSPKMHSGSPSSFSILSPKRERDGHSPCDQLPQFVHSPTSHHVLLIPSKPELTVTVVNSVSQPESSMPMDISKSPSPAPVQIRINPVEEMTVESEKDEDKSSNAAENEDEEEVSAVRRKRRRRVFTPHPNLQKSMYRTRTVTKASLAAQNEKEELASQKVKNEVPSVKPIIKEAPVSLTLLSSRGGRKRSQRKLSTAEQLQQLREDRCIDLENSGSILRLINLKNVLTRQNFLGLPLEDQMTLLRALPDVDTVSDPGKGEQPSEDAFDNLFYNKACEDWKAKLIAGDFTPDMKLKQKQEAEREKARVDPWKRKHFEPIWGYSDVRKVLTHNPPEPPRAPSCTVTKEEPIMVETEEESPLKNETPISVLEVTEIKALTPAEEILPTPHPPSSESPPTPVKRVATNLDDEFPILSKRIRIIPPIPPPEIQGSCNEGFIPENSEELELIEEEAGCSQEVKELAAELDNELSCENEVPVPDEVDNEVTILNSPFSSSPCAPLSEEIPGEEASTPQELTTRTPDEEEVIIIETTSFEETTENILSMEGIPLDGKPYEEMFEDLTAEQISEVEIVDMIHQEEEEVIIEGNSENPIADIAQGEDPTQITEETVPEPIPSAEVEPEIGVPVELNVEVMSEPQLDQMTEGIPVKMEPMINPVVLSPPLNDVPVSTPSPKPILVSPITTSSIRLPISQPNSLGTERLSQPLILRMVSLTPPNGPLQQPPSVRLVPPHQPNSLQPIVLKPMGMGGVKSEPIRNQFIPVQPRTFLASLPEAGKPSQGPSISPLTRMNGPGTIGGIQSPGSPGNAKPKLSTVPPGSVNLDRSYQICNAVIQNSPNREQLQKQLVKPPPLTQNNRIMRPELGSTIDAPTTVIQMSRRASTPTLIQSSGQMQLQQSGVSPGQKVVLLNHHQGMAPLIRPIQQQQPQGLNHQIVVSSPTSSSNGIGQRGLGMNVTFTTKHNPTTNNQSTTTTLTSTPNIITPQQLALLFQQQHPVNQVPRPQQQQQTQILTHQLRTQPPQQQQQRPSIFITRPPSQSQQPQTQQVKILNSAQFSNQIRLGSPQILQFQQSQRPTQQLPQENMQFPIRAQIMTPNGETLTIHRAGGIQPMRVNSLRPTIHTMSAEQGKRGISPSGTSPLTIINRTKLTDNLVQSIVGNSQTHDSPPPSTLLNPAQNLADFITSQLTASNIRPISPLAYEPVSVDKMQQQRVPATSTSRSRESPLHPNSPSTSQQMSQSELFISNHQKSMLNSQQQQLGLNDLMTEATILDLQDALGDGSPYSLMRDNINGGGSSEYIHIERGVEEQLAPPPLQPNTPNGCPTNHNYSLVHKRSVEGGGLVQNSRVEGPGGEGLQQQHYVIVQTTGSNGMPQNLVLQASLLLQQGQQVKEDGKLGEGGPPRASSAPPTNPATVIIPQQSSHSDIHENKHMSFQDFSGIRLVYKDESNSGNEEVRRMEYCVTSAPSSYTLTPVSSAGGQGIVRMMNRSPASSPDVWNYSPVPASGHIVNVNLNGSTGSARIIPGQHPVISIPDTTNGSSSCSGMSSDFDLFSTIATTGNEGMKLENNGDSRPILIPVSMTNNNRQHFQPHTSNHGPGLGLSSNHGSCVCDLRAMTACRKCGAYSHNDCMKSGMELCLGCIIR